MFDNSGYSYHTGAGNVLWVLLEYSRHNHIGYALEKHLADGKPVGYTLKKRAEVKEKANEPQADQG